MADASVLLIRRQQLEVLAIEPRRRFEKRAVAWLVKTHPRNYRKLGDEGALTLVRSGIEKAREYGIDGETDVSELIRWMLEISPDFDRELAWARPVFLHAALPGHAKIEIFNAGLVDHHRT
jgi:hypothetical protein